jgi:HAD superfamily hydrolase (TIGR01484 family)
MIKMIAIDIDGTLVNGQKVMTQKVKETIQEAMRRGIKIVLCTGRPPAGIKPYADELGFGEHEDYIIAQNGAYILRADTDETVYKKTLTLAEVQEIYEFGKGFSAGTLLVGEHHYYSLEDEVTESMQKDATHRQRGHQRIGSHSSKRRDGFDEDPLHRRAERGGCHRIGHPRSRCVNDFYIVRSQDFLVEVMEKSSNKGTALTKLADHLGNRDGGSDGARRRRERL